MPINRTVSPNWNQRLICNDNKQKIKRRRGRTKLYEIKRCSTQCSCFAGGVGPIPNFLAEAEASFPHMSTLGPTGLLPLPAWLPPKPPENEEDLRCPKCDIVYYSKSSIKNHIQVGRAALTYYLLILNGQGYIS